MGCKRYFGACGADDMHLTSSALRVPAVLVELVREN
jgi:hypothetical protein